MEIDFRPATADEMAQFIYTSQVGFGDSTAESELERARSLNQLRPEWTLCAFEAGVIASQMATIPFVMRWNGRDIACGGVTAVSTLPTHRRRGLVRELMTRAFVAMREAGQPVAMLWASMAAIYQRFGYGIAHQTWTCDFDPRHLRFVDAIAVPGRTRMVKIGEARPLLTGPYVRFAAPRSLMLYRDESWWDTIVLRTWRPDDAPRLVAVYEEGDAVLGYVIYGVERHGEFRPGPSQRVNSGELVWLTPAAHRALVSVLVGYDLADSVWLWRLPVDDPLFHHVQEPRLLQPRVADGTLVRVVDVQPALEGRGYDADGRLTFRLADDLCPWNAGTWRLTVEGGTGRLRRTSAEPDLCLTPRALAILASSHQPATTLARGGLIPAADARALAAADALFRTTHAPLCMDGF
jgi:predicted acetyltransferase